MRHGIGDEEAFRPQPFSLVVTISDPEKKTRVYDEMAQIVRNRFQLQNLTIRAAAHSSQRGRALPQRPAKQITITINDV
jgi:dihydroneopterin aldolase